MPAFEKDEIISATQLVRQFSTFLSKLTDNSLKKLAIIRNNEMQAVVIPVEEYERLTAIEQKARRCSVKDYFGTMDEDTFMVMENAVKECRKVDADEW